ncbi:MAG: SDR family oxidoreductase [Fidelibacterota bacterium]
MSKTIVITGATDGIGKQAALRLAADGHRLLLIGRNPVKGKQVAAEIQSQTGNSDLKFYPADLSLMKEIKTVCDVIKTDLNSLDVLLNNAGAFFNSYATTGEGLERTFALNHMNYFFMTQNLLPLLRQANSARIVNVSSDAHKGNTLDWENIQGEKEYSGWKAYGRSKLMNILFTYALARRLSDTAITVNCLHPGFVKTRFGDNNTGFMRWLIGAAKALMAINKEKGSDTSVYLAVDPEVANVTGKYFVKCKAVSSSPVSYDTADQERLWQLSEKVLNRLAL